MRIQNQDVDVVAAASSSYLLMEARDQHLPLVVKHDTRCKSADWLDYDVSACSQISMHCSVEFVRKRKIVLFTNMV